MRPVSESISENTELGSRADCNLHTPPGRRIPGQLMGITKHRMPNRLEFQVRDQCFFSINMSCLSHGTYLYPPYCLFIWNSIQIYQSILHFCLLKLAAISRMSTWLQWVMQSLLSRQQSALKDTDTYCTRQMPRGEACLKHTRRFRLATFDIQGWIFWNHLNPFPVVCSLSLWASVSSSLQWIWKFPSY